MSNLLIMWILIIYSDDTKTDIIKVFKYASIGQVAYILNLDSRDISNYYHNLINARGNLKYCDLYKE